MLDAPVVAPRHGVLVPTPHGSAFSHVLPGLHGIRNVGCAERNVGHIDIRGRGETELAFPVSAQKEPIGDQVDGTLFRIILKLISIDPEIWLPQQVGLSQSQGLDIIPDIPSAVG